MSTALSVTLYVGFCLWRYYADRVAAGHRAKQDAELMTIRAKLAAIETALRQTPFLNYPQ